MEAVWQDFKIRYIQNPLLVPVKLRESIHINSRLMVEAVKHASVDLRRMAHLHFPGSNPDNHKYAGFLAKWVAKIRPVYIEEGVQLEASLHYINADLALWTFRSFLTKDIPEELADCLQYILHYRDEKGETLGSSLFGVGNLPPGTTSCGRQDAQAAGFVDQPSSILCQRCCPTRCLLLRILS